jgi:hypothetical protein
VIFRISKNLAILLRNDNGDIDISINNINIAVQLLETVRTLSQKKLIFPAVETIAYKLTEKKIIKLEKLIIRLKVITF